MTQTQCLRLSGMDLAVTVGQHVLQAANLFLSLLIFQHYALHALESGIGVQPVHLSWTQSLEKYAFDCQQLAMAENGKVLARN